MRIWFFRTRNPVAPHAAPDPSFPLVGPMGRIAGPQSGWMAALVERGAETVGHGIEAAERAGGDTRHLEELGADLRELAFLLRMESGNN